VTCSRMLQLACIGAVLAVSMAQADQTIRMSTRHLVAESATVIVTHDHDVKPVDKPGAASDEYTLELNSTLRIVRKRDNAEIFKQAVMPLTALTSVDGGRYFAGLSSLQALSFAYNFLLISANGEIVTTALITPTSGHCRSVRWSTTNVIAWFDENVPDVQLSFVGDRVDTVTVGNPYDTSDDGSRGKCVIRVAAAKTKPAAKP